MASVEYGSDLQGSLLTVVHDICEHERVYGDGLQRSLQWKAADIALNPAFISSAQVDYRFKILSAVMQIDDGAVGLHVHNSSRRDIPDDDWYAEDVLNAFNTYLANHFQAEHELCLAALARKQITGSKLVCRRSATTGAVLG